MKNILITGCHGQLGSEFKNLEKEFPNYKFFFRDLDLDITQKKKVEDFIKKNKINVILNTAAYTNVNNAEIEKNNADLVNVEAVKNLVDLSEKHNCKLIHYSTDYVYDGTSKTPINEKCLVNPINYYGESKRKGEIFIENSPSESIVIRTSWLYSRYGHNFVNTIIAKAKKEKEINVVNDQFGCPTYAKDLARDTLKILESNIKLDSRGKVYNYSNLESTNWSGFAEKIIELLNIECEINEVSTAFFKSSVKRPAYSITNKALISSTFNLNIPKWEDSLKTYLTNFQL